MNKSLISKLENFERPMQLVPVGKITRPHGLKGEMKFVPFAVDDDILACLDQIYLETSGSPQECRLHARRQFLTFERRMTLL